MYPKPDSSFAIRRSSFPILILLLVTTAFYAHALDFGFIWDDPFWYGRVLGRSVGELIMPMPDYHFYRPTLVLYNRLFVQQNGTFATPLLHAAQLGWHLLNIALVYTLSRNLRLGRWTALAIGALVACYPFSYQAVAWAAPAQPMAAALQNGALLVYILSHRYPVKRSILVIGLGLPLFLTALTVQEGAAAIAILPFLMEWIWHRLDRHLLSIRGILPALLYPLAAAGFGLLWLQIPRKAGYTGLTFDISTPLYFLQGITFPLWGRPWGYEPGQSISPGLLLTAGGLTLSLLLIAAWRTGRGKQALFGLIWALLGIAPAALGLQYDYVKLGSRLFYYAAPGIALLWVIPILPKDLEAQSTLRRLWRIGGIALLLLILLQSGLLLDNFRRMYNDGVAHLDEMIQTHQDGHQQSNIYINFPDRYKTKRSPYPLGYWGVTLAPVSVELEDFAAVTIGISHPTISRSMPWIDTKVREKSPYQVNMRGIVAQPEELYQSAHNSSVVYLSHYASDGSFSLQRAGTVVANPSQICRMIVFSQTICLQNVQIHQQADELVLDLTWFSLSKARVNDTIFVHLGTPGQPPVAQADGDAWRGILPLHIWQPGDVIREQRIIPLLEGEWNRSYKVQIGIYNRITGERLPAQTLDTKKITLPDGTFIFSASP